AGTTLVCSATSSGGTTTRALTIKVDTQPPIAAMIGAPARDANTHRFDFAVACADTSKDGISSGLATSNPSFCGGSLLRGLSEETVFARDIRAAAGNVTTFIAAVPTAHAGAPQTIATAPGVCQGLADLHGTFDEPLAGRPLSFTWTDNGTLVATGL